MQWIVHCSYGENWLFQLHTTSYIWTFWTFLCSYVIFQSFFPNLWVSGWYFVLLTSICFFHCLTPELCVLSSTLQHVSVSLSGSICRTDRCPCLCFLLLFLHCCTWPWFVLLDRGDEKRGSRGLPLSHCLIREDEPVPSRSSGFSTSRSLSWPFETEIPL